MKTIKINNNHYIDAKVMMLATGNLAKRGELVINNELPKDKLFIAWIDAQRSISQHLYILSNEEIKVNDWIYDTINKIVYQVGSIMNNNIICPKCQFTCHKNNAKKIIATTDSFLKQLIIPTGFKSGIGALSHSKEIELPQPSKEFIKAYIESYNKGEVIEDVLVELETIGKYYDTELSGYKYLSLNDHYQLKLQDNTIIIIFKN